MANPNHGAQYDKRYLNVMTTAKLKTSQQRREAEADKVRRLRAEIAAIDSPVRVMKPHELQACREQLREKIGGRVMGRSLSLDSLLGG